MIHRALSRLLQPFQAHLAVQRLKLFHHYTRAVKTKSLLDIAKHDWNDVIQIPEATNKVTIFNSVILQILDTHCPYKRIKTSNCTPPWMTDEILYLIENIKKCYKFGNVYWKILRNRIVNKLRIAKRNYITKNINDMSLKNTAEWWKLINTLDGRTNQPELPLHLLDGEWVTKSDFAKVMNTHFLSQRCGDRISVDDELNTSSTEISKDQR